MIFIFRDRRSQNNAFHSTRISIRSQIFAWTFRSFHRSMISFSWITGKQVNFSRYIQGKRPDFQEIYELFNFWNASHLTKFPNVSGNSGNFLEKFFRMQSSVLGGILEISERFSHLLQQLGHLSPAISGNSTKMFGQVAPKCSSEILIWMTYPATNSTV